MNFENKNTKRVTLFNTLFTIENKWQNVLYVHTPFCVRKCYYCIYLSKEPAGKEELETFYSHVLPQQIDQYRPTLEQVPFHQVYFGGGTPTIADVGTLEKMYNNIPGFEAIPIKATEASPYTVTDEHLDLFHRYRFNYVSLGVQTLSERVLKAQNRLIADREKLIHLCRRLEQYHIINNIDLICYLDSGDLEDLVQSRKDLEYVMSCVSPLSITIHYNYMSKKSYEKRKAMIRLLAEMVEQYPEYQCVNSLLEEQDVEYDMNHAAEYRLMRKHKDFVFYMIPKIPESHTYGHNMLALGEYEKFKPRYNYFYIFDFMDKYMYLTFFNKLDSIIQGFNQVREKLHLAPQTYVSREDFFANQENEEKFKDIIKKYGLPYHDFSKDS